MRCFLCWITFLLVFDLQGQKSFGGMPPSFAQAEKNLSQIPGIRLNPIEKQNTAMPTSISIPRWADISVVNSGRRQALKNGAWIWQTSIEVPESHGLVVMFDQFYLAPGSQLFFYSEDKKTILGAYTQYSNPDGGPFLLGILPASKGIIELVEPNEVKGQSQLEIFRVDGILNNDTESCHIGVACSEELKQSREGIARVMMVLKEGMGFCSGSLINNTAQDGKQLILTSFHCQDGFTPLYHLWKFEFDYFDPVCGSNVKLNAPSTSVLGANFLAGGRSSDFLLLEITQPIPSETQVVYNGWNRNPEPPSSSVIFHHPKGDLKKITTSTIPATVFNNQIQWNNRYVENGDTFTVVTPPNHHFRVNYNLGFIETGSSGAPLFNSNGEILGQLHGGNQMCNNGIVFFGRLFNSWNGNGTKETRLSDWLDPIQSGVTTLSSFTSVSKDTLKLEGTVKNELGTPIVNAIFLLYQNGVILTETGTDATGHFSLDGLSPGTYELSIIKPDRGNNGVSTMDLIDVQKHVIQTKPFNSIIKLIAADVNKSGSVTTQDLIKIRRVILGMDCCFTNEENEWLFFRQNELIENKLSITLTESRRDYNLIGIKIGDVNNSALTGN
jgi:lysyl endopeptidase